MVVTAESLTEHLKLADTLLAGRNQMFEPQDLPGRYGRVVVAIDTLLTACKCYAVVGGGWAVWRHGYLGRVTQDIDIALSKSGIADFLQAAPLAGFEILESPPGNWPKMRHRETSIEVDILPEGGTPGTAGRPAPTTIPHPETMGAVRGRLTFMSLSALVELKLAAGRLRDEADIVELIRENREALPQIAAHLATVHPTYADRFAELVSQADE